MDMTSKTPTTKELECLQLFVKSLLYIFSIRGKAPKVYQTNVLMVSQRPNDSTVFLIVVLDKYTYVMYHRVDGGPVIVCIKWW